jgi:hypothetical protein
MEKGISMSANDLTLSARIYRVIGDPYKPEQQTDVGHLTFVFDDYPAEQVEAVVNAMVVDGLIRRGRNGALELMEYDEEKTDLVPIPMTHNQVHLTVMALVAMYNAMDGIGPAAFLEENGVEGATEDEEMAGELMSEFVSLRELLDRYERNI